MTREEILALAPGPALNDAVAEHVMGWKRITLPGGWSGWWLLPDRRLEPCSRDFSGNWHDAKMVLDQLLRGDRYWVYVKLGFKERTADRVEALLVSRSGDGSEVCETYYGPLPEAVCKLALLGATR